MMQPILIEDDMPIDFFTCPKGKPVALSPLATPLSQATTAPSTPLLSLLPDPFNDTCGAFSRTLSSGSNCVKYTRTYSGDSTYVPEEEYDDNNDLSSEEFALDPVPSMPTISEKEHVPVLAIGLPAMQSELGRWAKAVVSVEEWLEQELSQKRLEAEFLVDCSHFETVTHGLAFRRSKNPWDRDCSVAGPLWGTVISGEDHGDGWLKVGELYLPMNLAGIPVLSRLDGPALTRDGRAVDLETGAALYFSSNMSTEAADDLKDAFRLHAAARLAHAACEAEWRLEAGEVAAIDSAGMLHGSLVAPTVGDAADKVRRLKHIHRGRQARRRMGLLGCVNQNSILCAGADGKVFLYLSVEQTAERRERLQRKRSSLSRPQAIFEDATSAAKPWPVDSRGVVCGAVRCV